LTTESFDVKTRNIESNEWLKNVSCIVVDEAHIIGQEKRGGSIEATLMRFTKINPKARLILLTATLENADEMTTWIKSLNGKQTIKLKSDWRPKKIKKFFCFFDRDEKELESKIKIIKSIVNKSHCEKIIVFVHSKRLGNEIMSELRKSGIRCAFHNASLNQEKRRMIETEFNSKISGLNVLISTSTLAAGVNL
jgi:replicative superfamily II helicase